MPEELVSGCWWFDLGGVNAYLIEEGDDVILVDAGMPWDADDLRAEITATGHDLDDVTRVLVTHYDLDHVGTLAKLPLDAPIHVGAKDVDFLLGRQRPPLSNRKGFSQWLTGLFLDAPEQADSITDGDEFGSFTAYDTPGHALGHVAFVSRERGVALLGDLVRESDGDLNPSPWFMSYDTGVVRESIRYLLRDGPQFDVACVGHGQPLVTGGRDTLARSIE
ncbi:hypothetical protein A4G99_17390 [Haladaptatus sp. R4]|uniref:MBL fold metallo-hydrolase n=1 Tax=Haladaptatus sp. R4 TaxID=1679489 RepID=UPI0007B4A759|nr:MBL fold metallo-hydrolase [Haladaptatus sp. R4]KZN22874.1 hypothetical protein A4G99_17390 [Haladaptatus sp. R4]